MLWEYSVDHHFVPNLLLSNLFDLANYILISVLLYIVCRHYKISKNLTFVILISLLTPFFFNGLAFDWGFLPDQSKYFKVSRDIRDSIFIKDLCTADSSKNLFCGESGMHNETDKVWYMSLFFSLSPLVSIETYRSIGFMNRGLLLFTIIFFYNKKIIKNDFLLFFLISPSMILYSSVTLRETPIIVLMIFFIYFYQNSKYLPSIICAILLYLIKEQNVLILIAAMYLIYIFEGKKVKLRALFFSQIIFLLFFLIFKDSLLIAINEARMGLFVEQFGHYGSLSSVRIYETSGMLHYNFSSLKTLLIYFFEFIISPIRDLNSGFKIIILFENIFLFYFMFHKFKFYYIENKGAFFAWFFILLFSFFMYSSFLFNDAQIHRYKTPIIFFVLFGLAIEYKNKKSKV